MREERLTYEVQGKRDGIAILMIHPLGADRRFWDETRFYLNSLLSTVSCDLRGSGCSPDLDRPLTLDMVSDDIESIREELGLTRMVVAGCAVGAMAAARYAVRYPEIVAALVMSNPGFRITPEGKANLSQRADVVRKQGMQSLLPQAIENAFFGYYDTERCRLYEERFVRQKPENYALAALGVADGDISADFRSIVCPVLLVPGTNDRLFPAPHTREILNLLPNADVAEFPQGAHFIPYQQPQEFAAAVSAFLERRNLLVNSPPLTDR
ncbi:alpha/beta hydrolase [Phyllobacterium sp. SB3]|uniref:alpha/beta fold hydrolase n=1 Tax=Phyllobacterium sp. SB3 TaxID=3156073 RepID=UPI0032AEDDBE